MKSKTKLKLTFQICFLFFFVAIHAQKVIDKGVLLGEWYYNGADNPILNETVIIEKVLDNKTEYKKWIFKESYEFIFQAKFKKVTKYTYSVVSKGDKWYLNDTNQLMITKNNNKQEFYRIISGDRKVIKMVRTK